jgi:2-succinyl-6-hydroxy-2,4-cyclohexadiene-1-carboxylate synthase
MTWVALHGFLGTPSDWRALVPGAAAPDLFAEPWDWGRGGLAAAGRAVNAWAEPLSRGRFLLGYSMGARVAMHAALSAPPGFWRGLVLVSGHPGLPLAEREARCASDEIWAARIESCEPAAWPTLVAQWNAQGVFAGSRLRDEAPDFARRSVYARALRSGSLGQQEELGPALRALDLPVLWVTGAADSKFTELARVAARPQCHREVPDAGHRVPWDATPQFVEILKDLEEKTP